MNQRAKCRSKVNARTHRRTQRPDCITRPLKRSVINLTKKHLPPDFADICSLVRVGVRSESGCSGGQKSYILLSMLQGRRRRCNNGTRMLDKKCSIKTRLMVGTAVYILSALSDTSIATKRFWYNLDDHVFFLKQSEMLTKKSRRFILRLYVTLKRISSECRHAVISNINSCLQALTKDIY